MQIKIKKEDGTEAVKEFVSVILIDDRTLASICLGEYEGAPNKLIGGIKTLEDQSDLAKYNPEYFTATIESINPDDEKRTVGGDLEQHQVLNRKAKIMFEMPPLTQSEMENLTQFLKLDKAEVSDAHFRVAYEDMRCVKTGVQMYVQMTLSAERMRRINKESVWHGLELAFIEM